MSDAAPPTESGRTDRDAAPTVLSPESIEAVLRDFRTWLGELDSAPTPTTEPAETVDLFTLVSQFTALRHEVNMQTKAARAAVESNAETLRQLAAATSPPQAAPPSDEPFRPMLKAMLDIADALDLAHAQVEKLRGTVEPLLAELQFEADEEPLPPPSSGFFGKLLGRTDTLLRERLEALQLRERDRAAKAAAAASKLGQILTAASEGYLLSRRRIERFLPTFDLERIPTVGQVFDPDTMEAMERVEDSDRPAGEVLGEVRPGYLWKGRLFRYAQVRVARG